MKAHQFISALDEARTGNRRLREDTNDVGSSPSHAPTSTAEWKTPSSGKSKDEGERTGSEKDAIKQSKHSIPTPIAKAPSHAPTSTAQWKTTGDSSKDEGEKIDKSNVGENLVNALLNAEDEDDIAAILGEGGHKSGCGCGFCKNKGSFGKKKEDSDSDADKGDDNDKDMSEALPARGLPSSGMPPRGMPSRGVPPRGLAARRPMGAGAAPRMGFRHPSASSPTRPKATMAPYQPSMERLDRSNNPKGTIQEMADELLDSPDNS